MEGLLIAEQLRALAPLLPAERRAWRFPDDRTAVLPLAGDVSLWLSSRPPQPRFELRSGAPGAAPAKTPFQEQLAARASGELVSASQPALDRVVRFEFAAGDGFVPEPGVSLVAELTGRNANLLLLAADDNILGVERVILTQRNRYRELRPGVAYVPPPPYQKLDPMLSSEEELAAALRGRRLEGVRDVVDGIGPELFAALRAMLAHSGATGEAEAAAAAVNTPAVGGLDGERLAVVVAALKRLALEPSKALAASGNDADVVELRRERRLRELRGAVASALDAHLKLAARRVADAEQAVAAVADAGRLREEADLLLANAAAFEPEGTSVTLRDYDGTARSLDIDQRLDAAGNAAARYDRARRREVRAARAAEQLPELRRLLTAIEADRDLLESADEARLRRLASAWVGVEDGETAVGSPTGGVPARGRSGARSAQGRASAVRAAARPGVRFIDPRGYEVFVGRSAKENDAITFKLARSRDLWLHVQGYRGAHVLVRSQGRELPFDTVLFAARLAAGFSQARDSDNVPVDYTERKHVWRQKGGPAGAVNFAHHKTVYVSPARDDAAARGAQGAVGKG